VDYLDVLDSGILATHNHSTIPEVTLKSSNYQNKKMTKVLTECRTVGTR
jgi:hypothetical protein